MLFNSLSINITPMSVIDLMRNLVVRCAGDNAEECYKKWEEILDIESCPTRWRSSVTATTTNSASNYSPC